MTKLILLMLLLLVVSPLLLVAPQIGSLRGMDAFQLAQNQSHPEIAAMMQPGRQTGVGGIASIDGIASGMGNIYPRNSGIKSKLTLIFSIIYGLCCLGMLFSGGFYILFELLAIVVGFIIWCGGSQKKSFWSQWLIATFIPIVLLPLGPIGIGLSLVARFIIIRIIR